MRSKVLPSQPPSLISQNDGIDADLDLQLGIAQKTASSSTSSSSDKGLDDSFSTDWEQWGEDQMIELCTVSCDYNGSIISQWFQYSTLPFGYLFIL